MYGLVEATESWVDARLAALAGALHLPCPVRDGFVFRADEAFYKECTESVVTLQKAARRIIDHLGLRCDSVVVSWKSGIDHPAHIELDGGHWFIEIDPRHRGDGPALGAILAHEVCHILVVERRLRRFDTAVDEVHVDLAALLGGLGPLTLNGIVDRTWTSGGRTWHQHRSFGYLRAHLLRYAWARIGNALGLGRRAREHLRGSRAEMLLLSWRVSRKRLRFRKLEPHVVVSCACARRLRVPTGAVGRAKCPECGAARGFDGRACAVLEATEPQPMTEAPLPPNTRWHRFRVALARMSTAARLSLAFVALVFMLLAGANLYAWARQQPVGGPCDNDVECRSDRCLHLLRGPGYCTANCRADGDCPDGFRCGTVELRSDWGGLFDRSAIPISACTRQ